MAAQTDGTLWPLEPHTEAKHRILRRYLQAWFPILSRWHGKVVYFDGFAGPGEYEGGEPGSPLIALGIVTEHVINLDAELQFVFVESRKDRCEHLKQLLEVRRTALADNVFAEVYCEEFEDVLRGILDDMDERGAQLAPFFAFIDPFGTKGIPMELIHRLLERQRTEAFINFNVRGHYRFADHVLEAYRENTIAAFGTDEIMNISEAEDREKFARELYEKMLRKKAKYVRFFRMLDEKNVPIYDLFFATNNEKGHLEMKRAMWNVDEWGAFRFSDATDPNALVLFEPEPEKTLLPMVMAGGSGRKNIDVANIRSWIENETPFLTKHMKAALRLAEEKDQIQVRERKKDGKLRRSGTFPDGVVIDFVD